MHRKEVRVLIMAGQGHARIISPLLRFFLCVTVLIELVRGERNFMLSNLEFLGRMHNFLRLALLPWLWVGSATVVIVLRRLCLTSLFLLLCKEVVVSLLPAFALLRRCAAARVILVNLRLDPSKFLLGHSFSLLCLLLIGQSGGATHSSRGPWVKRAQCFIVVRARQLKVVVVHRVGIRRLVEFILSDFQLVHVRCGDLLIGDTVRVRVLAGTLGCLALELVLEVLVGVLLLS